MINTITTCIWINGTTPMGKQFRAQISGYIDLDLNESIEEVRGPYQRVDRYLEASNLQILDLHEIELDRNEMEPLVITEFDEDIELHARWLAYLTRLGPDVWDYDDIVYENEDLWEDYL